MTVPTSTILSDKFSNYDILNFNNGIDSNNFSGFVNPVPLFGISTTGALIDENNKYFIEGSFNFFTNVFTIGAGSSKLFWTGTADEFLAVGKTGGNWEIQE